MGSLYNCNAYAILSANFVASVANGARAPTAKSFAPYPFSPGGSSLFFSGYYLSAMWFLTGESKALSYQVDDNSNGGTFRQVKVLHPLSQGGYGAVALTARLSEVDLNSGPFQGNTYNTLYALVLTREDFCKLRPAGRPARFFRCASSVGAFLRVRVPPRPKA